MADQTGEHQHHLLGDALGAPALVFFVLSAIAPLTSIIGYVPLVFGLGNGAGAAGTFVFAAVIWIIFAVGYTRMSHYIRNAGPFYAFISQGIGRAVGISAAYLALVLYIVLDLAVYGLFGWGMKAFAEPHLHINLPWWIYSVAAAGVIFVLAYRRISIGARVVALLCAAEMTLILLLSITILVRHTPEGLSATPFTPKAIFGGGAGIAMMFAFGMFVGFESTVVYGEEVRHPRRTIPLATYISIALIGVIFSLSSYAITMGWGVHGVVTQITSILTHGGDPGTLTTDLARSALGEWSVAAVQILFMTSVFAFLIAFHNISVRYMFSLGRSGLLPKAVGRTHHDHKSPHIASAVQTVIAAAALLGTAALGWDPYLQVSAWLAAVALLGFLVLYVVTSVAVICFFHRNRSETGLWATKVAPGISGAAIIWAIVLTVTNFDGYVGPGHALAATILRLSIPVIVVAGLGVAFWLRQKRPAVFSSAGVSIEITPEAAEIIDAGSQDTDLRYQVTSNTNRERHDNQER